MKFSDIAGMEKEKQELRSLVDAGKIPHALLFHGPQGTGKMRLARAFVQYLCCTNRSNGDSCGVCPSCQQTSKFNNPDVHYVYPIVRRSSPTRNISKDYIGEWHKMLEENSYMQPERWLDIIDAGNSQPAIYVTESEEISRIASLTAYGSRYKMFVIWLPEKLNVEAANKILKLVEEPFQDTLFIMVSNEPSLILPTIFSRLRRIGVNRLADQEIADWLMRKYSLPVEEGFRIARIAQGNIAKAEELMDMTGEIKEFTDDFINSMRSAYSRNIIELKSLSEKFTGYGREKSIRLIQYFSRMVRENFIYNLKVPALNAMTLDEEKFSSRFSPFVNVANIEQIHDEIDKVRTDISRNANQKIVWFDFLLRLLVLLRMTPK